MFKPSWLLDFQQRKGQESLLQRSQKQYSSHRWTNCPGTPFTPPKQAEAQPWNHSQTVKSAWGRRAQEGQPWRSARLTLKQSDAFKRFLTIIVNFHSKEVMKLPQQVSFPLLPKYGSLFMKLFSYKSNICFCKRNEIKEKEGKIKCFRERKKWKYEMPTPLIFPTLLLWGRTTHCQFPRHISKYFCTVLFYMQIAILHKCVHIVGSFTQ